ncbi:MAG: hypothetical protein ACO29X_06460 [Arcobacteraceae bacterium]
MLSLSNAELINNLTLLADFIGRVDEANTTSIKVNALANEDITENDTLCVLSGSNKNIDLAITDSMLGTFTFDAITTACDVRDIVAIIKLGFDNYTNSAYEILKNDLKNKGVKIELFLTEWQLKQLFIYKTLALICGDRRNSSDTADAYNANFERYDALYSSELTTFVADYDISENGSISEDEESIYKSQVGFVR